MVVLFEKFEILFYPKNHNPRSLTWAAFRQKMQEPARERTRRTEKSANQQKINQQNCIEI